MRTSVRRSNTLMAFLILVCVVLPAYGQNPRIQLANLERLSKAAAEVVDVTLDGPMLKMASQFLSKENGEDEAEVKDLVKNLKGIYVKSFEFDKEGEYTESDIEAIRNQLTKPNWARVVGVISKREKENCEVYLMADTTGDNVQGLTIIAAEPKELTVVNIIGPIDMDKLSALEGRMGVPKMELEKEKKPRKVAGSEDEKQ
jgi:uncharacterized hydantoinase/oxoprolinase family protein